MVGEGAVLVVVRDPQLLWLGNRFKVIIDNEIVGRLWRGGSKRFELSARTHSVQVGIGWSKRSRVLELHLQPGQTFTARARARSNPLLYVNFKPKRALVLVNADDPHDLDDQDLHLDTARFPEWLKERRQKAR